jgi:peroxiredoxin
LDSFPGKVYGLSTDSVKEHKKLKEELGLDFPLLSDEKLDFVQKAKMKNPNEHKSLRGFAVVDKEGKILHAEEVNPFGEEIEGIITFAKEKLQQ